MSPPPYGFKPLGYDQITGLSGAVGLPNVPDGAVMALISCGVAPVRWRDDGVLPTASVGMPLLVGQEFP